MESLHSQTLPNRAVTSHDRQAMLTEAKDSETFRR
jgi:hypothetical protein